MSTKEKPEPKQREVSALCDLQVFTVSQSYAEFEEEMWELLLCSMGSPESDMWTYQQRANALFNYRQLLQTAKALYILVPPFKKPKVELINR